jgi:hypothetical protein
MFGKPIAVSCLIAGLTACAAHSPVAADSRMGEQPTRNVVLALPAPCSLSPGGAPMGRPDGERGHTLPAGRYAPLFEDADGVFFASPSGVMVTEPAPRGTRERPGGIYLPRGTDAGAQQYLGDAERVTERSRLPDHCRFSLETTEGSRS